MNRSLELLSQEGVTAVTWVHEVKALSTPVRCSDATAEQAVAREESEFLRAGEGA